MYNYIYMQDIVIINLGHHKAAHACMYVYIEHLNLLQQ